MDTFVYLILLLVVLVFVLLLPLVSGVGSYLWQSSPKRTYKLEKQGQTGSIKSKMDKYLNVNKENMSLKFQVSGASIKDKLDVDSKTGLKRRVIGKFSKDTNEFDYEVEELIEEDLREERRAEEEHYAQFKGRENEVNEQLV